MNAKFAKVLVLGAGLGFGFIGSAAAAFGGDCCQMWYNLAMRGCAAAGNSYSYCNAYYTQDLEQCQNGDGGVFNCN